MKKKAKKDNSAKQEAKARKKEEQIRKKAEKNEEKAKKKKEKAAIKAQKQKAKQEAKTKKQEAKKSKKANKSAKSGKGENEEGKKKLNLKLLIPVLLLLVAGGALAAKFVLGGDKELTPPEAYAIAEESTIVLDSYLEEGGKLVTFTLQEPEAAEGEEPKEDKKDKDEETADEAENAEPQPVDIDAMLLYGYEGVTPAALEQYVTALRADEQGFIIVDENYNEVEELPVFAAPAEAADEAEADDAEKEADDAEPAAPKLADGTLLLAREANVEGRLFQVRLTWQEEKGACTVEISCPQAAFPEEPMMNTGSAMDYVEQMKPSDLGLPGESMEEYHTYSQGGNVVIDGKVFRKFTVYSIDEVTNTNDFVGVFVMSGNGRTIYRQDQETGELTPVKQ